MSWPNDDPRTEEVVHLLEELRQSYLRGTLKLYREHLPDDAVVLGIGDVTLHIGKDSVLDYLRTSAQKGWLKDVKSRVHDVKFFGDVAIVVETYNTFYEIKGKAYRDDGRATSVLVHRDGRWSLTLAHMERLASNPVAT